MSESEIAGVQGGELVERLKQVANRKRATAAAVSVGQPGLLAEADDLDEAASLLGLYKQALYDCDFHIGLGEPKDGTTLEIRETVRTALTPTNQVAEAAGKREA